MDLREVLAALRAGWWLPLGGLLLGTSGALGLTLTQQPLYTASTQFFVSTTGTGSTADAVQGSQFTQQRVSSYAQVLEGPLLAKRVVARLGLNLSPDALSQRITATVIPDSVLINVTVTDTSSVRAQAIAGALGPVFTQRVDELETPQDGGPSLVKVAVNETPELPSSPSSPQTARNVLFGALFGVILGAGIAILRVRLDRSVKRSSDVHELAGAPVVGTIFRNSTLEKEHILDRGGSSRTSEDYRQLRNNLQFLDIDNPPKIVLISSALPSEGKTTAVINLALALADADRKVTIVEADLRRPKVTTYLGIIGAIGLTDLFSGNAKFEQIVQSYGDNGLQVIPAGPTPPNPGELLASKHMADLLAKLRAENDFVLIDGPPLLPVADASGLAVRTDGVLLSVRYGSTHRDQLRQAAANISRVGARTLGVILNIVPPNTDVAAAYGYGYGYEYVHIDEQKPSLDSQQTSVTSTHDKQDIPEYYLSKSDGSTK